jgi:DNA modification methylase
VSQQQLKLDTIIVGDALGELSRLPDESIDCIVTSPPYYGQRSYTNSSHEIGLRHGVKSYVVQLSRIFAECRRVLSPWGTLWLNLGDKYSDGSLGTQPGNPKNLMLLPARVALKLQQDNWILRNDIIWHKANPMPESVKDRCTSSHEHVFFFTRSQKYYFNPEAIKTKSLNPEDKRSEDRKRVPTKEINGMRKSGHYEMANARDVWKIPLQPFKEAHFATFPEELVKRCILAGCPEGGVVLDPFMGSGTTGLVAQKLNRRFIGIELNKEYAEMAKKRIDGE